MKFVFVRHGESVANAANVLADAFSPLTEKGRAQAKMTAAKLRPLGITRIVRSSFLRAQQTAEIIAHELGIDIANINVIDELRERGMGELENTVKQFSGPHYYTLDEPASMEPRAVLLERSQRALQQIEALARSETLLVVGHTCSGFFLRQAAAGHDTLESFDAPEQMDNASYVEVDITR